MTIGERIKQQRLKHGLSVEELAEKLGKNRATVYRYENNDIGNLPITVLEPLARALNTTPAYLMGWENSEGKRIIASDSTPLYNVHCETEDEANLVLDYRKLSEFGKKKVIDYESNILQVETAENELDAAHERTDIEVTNEMRQHDDDIMDDDDF